MEGMDVQYLQSRAISPCAPPPPTFLLSMLVLIARIAQSSAFQSTLSGGTGERMFLVRGKWTWSGFNVQTLGGPSILAEIVGEGA